VVAAIVQGFTVRARQFAAGEEPPEFLAAAVGQGIVQVHPEPVQDRRDAGRPAVGVLLAGEPVVPLEQAAFGVLAPAWGRRVTALGEDDGGAHAAVLTLPR
jgi:hypothetical protein